ncbi:2-dehydropantoate 2-reductase [Pontibacillus yanchengensis]|uniref:2-dehydropantoate 2-reductase n=2 Tax=Pontibacillus yanchengensis TaxID=462910 RepID=A0ACC7VBL2_9BACI|nr:2-dehydropantoate 2-reductase [Pontibacillus yanchengensis]MYL52113.1 2-dehydropantoate 2-reductase [Pontibacillus yanchengensis]
MKIGIIGGGAIGLFFSFELTKMGHEVTLHVRRAEQMMKLDEEGLFVKGGKEPIFLRTRLITELELPDVLIICTKQHGVEEIIAHIKNLPQKTTVMFVQNGMGHVNWFEHLNMPVVAGVVEYGVLKHSDTCFELTGEGTVRFAPVTASKANLIEIIKEINHKESFRVELEENWYRMLAGKLIINSAINPVTALFNVRNGEIVHNEYLLSISRSLCLEACEVLELPFQAMWEQVQSIAMKTSNNISSMAKDIQLKRTTEIEAISGYVLQKATHPVPYTNFIYYCILAKEKEIERRNER